MEKPQPSFKSSTYRSTQANARPKVYKSLKQILTLERHHKWPEDTPLYSTLNAPPSFVPAKKYSDISGLKGKYRDPHTKLRFHNSEEYSTIQNLPSDIVNGYLQLRGHSSLVS